MLQLLPFFAGNDEAENTQVQEDTQGMQKKERKVT